MSFSLARVVLPFASVVLLTSAVLFGNARPDLHAVPVAGQVSVLLGSGGGNIGVQVGPAGMLMIDDKFARDADAIESALGTLAEGTPAYLINTHFHGDHTGGNPHFGAASTVLAHRNVRVRLVGDGKPEVALPVITFDDGLSLYFNGEELRLVHMPAAHTDGDTVVWFKGSGVVHMGDLFFQSGYPFVDVESGGSFSGLIAGVEAVLAMVPADTTVIPGHGDVTNIEGLRTYLEMLQTIVSRVRELSGEGFSLEELIEAKPTAEFDERWGGGFINSRRMIESITKSR